MAYQNLQGIHLSKHHCHAQRKMAAQPKRTTAQLHMTVWLCTSISRHETCTGKNKLQNRGGYVMATSRETLTNQPVYVVGRQALLLKVPAGPVAHQSS